MTPETLAIATLIKEARRCELIRDLETEAEILSYFWSDFSIDPPVENFAPEMKAEIYRICGKFLCNFGRAKALKDYKNYQERGKDLLSRSVDLFTALKNTQKASEAKCQLAYSYYFDGRTDNSIAVLNEAEKEFKGDYTNPALIEIAVGQLIINSQENKINDCPQIIEKVKPFIDRCLPHVIMAFFNVCGLIDNLNKNHRKAARMFEKTIKIAVDTKYIRAEAQALNNLAYTYLKSGDLKKALSNIEEAVSIAKSLKDKGWLANFYDTQANIELALNKFEAADSSIENSLNYLSNTSDLISHVESLWTKIEICLTRNDLPSALLTFNRLAELVRTEKGDDEAQRHAFIFSSKIRIFQIKHIEPKSDEILKNPDFGNIEYLNLPPEHHDLFFIPKSKSSVLNFYEDVVVAVVKTDFQNPLIMKLKESGEYLIGDLLIERVSIGNEGFEMCFLTDERGSQFPVSPEDTVICGSVAGIATYSDLKNNNLQFKNFENLER